MYLHNETEVWTEVTCLLIPGENDSDDELNRTTEWLVEHLGPNVPIHFTAFHPDWKMLDKPAVGRRTPNPPNRVTRVKVEELLTSWEL